MENTTTLEHILENTLSGYWDWNIPTGEEYLSPSFKKMFGYEDNELPNRAESWQKIIFQEDLPGVFENYEAHVASHGEVPFYNEVRYHHKNGATIWVICTGDVIEWDEAGNPLRMVGCHIDITDMKQDEALRSLSKEIHTIINRNDSLQHVIRELLTAIQQSVHCDAIGLHLNPEKSAIRRFKTPPCHFYTVQDGTLVESDPANSPCHCHNVHGGDSSAPCTAILSGHISSEDPHFTEYGSYIADEESPHFSEPYCSTALIPITVAEESIGIVQLYAIRPGAFSSHIIDTMETICANIGLHLSRILAEEERKEVESYSRHLFEQSPIGFLVCAMDGTFTDFNQAFADIIGYTKEECYSLTYWDVTPRKYEAQEEEQLALLATVGRYGPYEKEYIHKDGHLVPLVLNGTLVKINGIDHIWSTIEDVSDRKAIEQKLSKEQERFAGIYSRSNVGTWEWNVQTGETKFNSHWAEIVGYTLEELSPISIETWNALCHPEDLITSMNRIERCFNKEDTVYECETRMKHKDGHWVWVLDRGRVVSWTDNGKPLMMMGTHLDITDRKRAEEESQETRAVLDQFFDQPINLHIIASIDGRMLRINSGWTTLLGYDIAELEGGFFFDLIHPDDIEKNTKEMEKLGRGQRTFYFENRYRHKNGDYRIIAWSASTSPENGKVYAVGNDITERELAEEKIWEKEKHLSDLINHIPSILYSYSLDTGGVFYSPRAAEILGYPLPELIANPMLWHNSIHPDDRELVNKTIAGAQEGEPFKIQYRIADSSGEWHTFVDQSISLKMNGEVCVRIDGIADDITTQIKEAEERRYLTEQLHQAQKMEAVGQLAGGIAHDFNNALSAILGAADLISLGCLTNNEVLSNAEDIVTMGQRAGELTKKLLMFARKIPHQSEPQNLKELVEDTVKMLSHTIDKKIVIQFDTALDTAGIFGDSSLLQNAFINIGINASHAMPDGGTLSYKLSELFLSQSELKQYRAEIDEGDYFKLEITDTGTGIPADILPKIFDPFFSTKERDKGTGLGLSTVLGTIQEHHGTISVSSVVNEGTTFTILLPKHSDTPLNVGTEVELVEIPEKSATILMVDDEELLLKFESQRLRKWGYTVYTSTSGREAIDIVQKEKDALSLVILDIVMPEMDGTEVLSEIRTIAPDLPVIIASGYGSDHQLSKLNNLHYSAFLRKPFRRTELITAINDAIGSMEL